MEFVVHLLFDDGKDLCEVVLHDDIVAKHLGLTAAAYQSQTERLTKEESVEFRRFYCLQFQSFEGIFLVRRVSSVDDKSSSSLLLERHLDVDKQGSVTRYLSAVALMRTFAPLSR